ncbi:MAG: hypothetical protein AAGI52_07620 [Bacteroidota bacterium]
MRRLLPLFLLLATVTASAQPLGLRLGSDTEGTFEDLVEDLHVLAPGGADLESVTLFSALVSREGVHAIGRAETAPLAIDDELPEGITLRDSGVELPRDYLAARERRAIRSRDLFRGEVEIPGGDQFIPGGDQFIPGGDQFVGGVEEVSARGVSEQALLRAAERADAQAFESGALLVVFFAAPPDGGESELAVLRKRPGRTK